MTHLRLFSIKLWARYVIFNFLLFLSDIVGHGHGHGHGHENFPKLVTVTVTRDRDRDRDHFAGL